jgi:hypothetical protein
VILCGSFSGNSGGSGSGLGAVQLSGFTGTGSGAALDLPRSVLQSTGQLHGAVTNAGACHPQKLVFFKVSEQKEFIMVLQSSRRRCVIRKDYLHQRKQRLLLEELEARCLLSWPTRP